MAKNSVCFNGKTAVHKDSGGILTSFPDVCLTPIIIPVPIPYTNTSLSIDADKTASSVKVNGQPICNKDSNFAKSTGDEAGSVGGILSGTTAGKAEFITFSANVFVEGAPVVRMGDQMVSNNKNTSPVPLQQAGANNPSIADLTALCAQPVPSRHKLAMEVAGAEMKGLTGELIAENSDGKTFHLSLGRDTWAEKHRRQIFFENLPDNTYMLSLMFFDKNHGTYKIPLGRDLAVSAKDEEKDKWDTVLVPIIPRCYTSHYTEHTVTSYPRQGGWIYIFIDGYLWRELQVVEGSIPGQMRDVNLTYSKGMDHRSSEGGVTDSRIVVPYMVGGNSPDIEMCFSEVQWSWEYILKMGGMNPDDIRHNHGPSVEPCPDEGEASRLRGKRMQAIDLSGYPDFPTKLGDEWLVKNWYKPGKSEDHHLAPHQNSKIPVVILKDPLGVVTTYANQLSEAWVKMEDLVAALQTGQKPKYDFRGNLQQPETAPSKEDLEHQTKIKANFDMALALYQAGFGSEDNKKRYGDDLDRNLIEKLLALEERKKIHEEIQKYRSKLINFLEKEGSQYDEALNDYQENTDEQIIAGKQVVLAHDNKVNLHHQELDRHLLLPEDRDPQGEIDQKASKYLSAVLKEENIAGQLLAISVTSTAFWTARQAGAIYLGLVEGFGKLVIHDHQLMPAFAQAFNSVNGRGITAELAVETFERTAPTGAKIKANVFTFFDKVKKTALKIEKSAQFKGTKHFFGMLNLVNIGVATNQMVAKGLSFREITNTVDAIAGAGSYVFEIESKILEAAGREKLAGTISKVGRGLGAVSWFGTAIVAGVDSWQQFKDGDNDAGMAYGAAVVLSVATGAAGLLSLPITAAILTGCVIVSMVTAVLLTDDPLERFCKNGPFQLSQGNSMSGETWQIIRQTAAQPNVSEGEDYAAWQNPLEAKIQLYDFLFHYETELKLFDTRYSLPGDNNPLVDYHPVHTIEVTCAFRACIVGSSEFETMELRFYPYGMAAGDFSKISPSKDIEFKTEKNATKAVITYELPDVIFKQITTRSSFTFHSRLTYKPDQLVPAPNLKQVARFYGIAFPATEMASRTGLSPTQEFHHRPKRIATINQINNRGFWQRDSKSIYFLESGSSTNDKSLPGRRRA